MASRFSGARPKRAGENYARQHHNAEPDSKKVRFDVRNPSALAPDAADEDDEAADVFLEADADVIRGSAATKRGAVNIDGYDSDSDQEELGTLHTSKAKKKKKDADEDMDDMFAEDDDDDDAAAKDDTADGKKSKKEVHFMSTGDIEGEEGESKSGGRIRLDGGVESSDDDEEAIALAIQEEAVDDEVGAGGRKKHAPKLEAFNLKAESEEGRFDEAGNFVRRAVDPDAVHDRWLEGLSKKDMRRAAEAHERREAEQRRRRREEDSALTADLLRSLIAHLERGETVLEALARLGRAHKKTAGAKKAVPKWKQKRAARKSGTAMDVDEADEGADGAKGKELQDPEQARVKDAIDAITDAADKLLGRDRPDVYDRERERLIREYVRETDEEWVEPTRPQQQQPAAHESAAAAAAAKMWEYRWTDGRDGADKQGPFDGHMMKAWQDAGYFGEGVEFREVGDDIWSRTVDFV